ncbi:MAG: alpha-mannosidase [Lentisphaerae bacterium]|nr:alpha-mannosidase [Lentisphaerota bacterium]
MSSDADINAVVARRRRNVRGKFRGIASFEERAQLRFDVIKAMTHRKRVPAPEWEIRYARYLAPDKYEFLDDWRPIPVGGAWGGEDITAFFRQTVTMPDELDGEKVALNIFVGGDSMFRLNGEPHHGMDIFRGEVPLTPKARAGETMLLEIESYMNFHGISAKQNELLASDLVAIDQEVTDAYWDLWCAAKVLQIPQIDAKLKDYIESNLWEAMSLVPLGENDPAVVRDAILAAREAIRKTVYSTDRFKGEGCMNLVGHSHLDVVFMWPYKEFVRKVGRTHATMLRLMEEYPQFIFAQSQAKIYADMKTHHPEIFEQVKQRVAEGRWEPIGAFWVEPDCNLISGESFVRQIMHGQRFFQDNFGMTSRTCWQPDVFGLSWAMPQILRRSGVEYFISNKMVSWNDTNPWTMNTFWWEGTDGSRILGVVPPGHFIGTVDPDVLDRQWRAFSDRDTIGRTLHVYGWGDGGGGVDPEMIESAKRYGDFPGLVKTEFSTVESALDKIAEKAAAARLPVLRDEIYLEAHRGTYTHRARLKKLNRRAELLYRETEMLAALAWTGGAEYPEKELDAGWKDLLTTQSHNSLPGTHVPPVYQDLLRDYDRIYAVAEQLRDESVAQLLSVQRRADADSVVLFNSLSFERADTVCLPADLVAGRAVTDARGTVLPQQDVKSLDDSAQRLVRGPAVPACGFSILRFGSGRSPKSSSGLRSGDHWIENEFLHAEFNDDGELVSLLDRQHDRQVLANGDAGNRFQLFEDTPGEYDAWDIVETYSDHPVPIPPDGTLKLEEKGPVRASLRLEKSFGSSRMVQRISLYAGSPSLYFETAIDWEERQRLLKVAFPVAVNTSQCAYDMAFGHIARATHRNTSFDRAKFEVPAHQWMDLSQADYGVSLLNDCKYGCDAAGKVMRLTLLKGSIHPDPEADVERHFFTYAIFPHPGDWRQAGTMREAMMLNHPHFVFPANIQPHKLPASLIECSAPNVTIEAVKRSEDGKNLVIRLVERHNATSPVSLSVRGEVKRAWACDLMERNERKLGIEDGAVRMELAPCEIATVRLDMAE